MNVTKNVKDVVGKFLEENGFVYHKDVNIWHYERKKGETSQNIVIQRHRYFAGYIKAIFYTDAYGQRMREFKDFVPDMQNPFQEFWEYETDKELKEILYQFVDWIRKHGFELLESISVPTTEIRPKRETNLYLYQNHNKIYERYKKEWKLDCMNGEEVIQVIWENIGKLYDKKFSEIEKNLVEFAAIYGYTLFIDGIGEWIWDEEKETCFVYKAGGMKARISPLEGIILSYRLKENAIKERYIIQFNYRQKWLRLKEKEIKNIK